MFRQLRGRVRAITSEPRRFRVSPSRLPALFRLALIALAACLLGSAPTAGAAGNRWVRADPLVIAHQGGEDESREALLEA